MERFIGLDVHAASTTCAVIDARGKRVRVDVVETNGQALIEFLKLQPGTLRLCMEEGTQATWLAEIPTPHVAQLAVVHVSQSRGPKDDERDALALAEQMRNGKLDTTVYKHVGPFGALRNLVKTHSMVVRDVVRTQNRIADAAGSAALVAQLVGRVRVRTRGHRCRRGGLDDGHDPRLSCCYDTRRRCISVDQPDRCRAPRTEVWVMRTIVLVLLTAAALDLGCSASRPPPLQVRADREGEAHLDAEPAWTGRQVRSGEDFVLARGEAVSLGDHAPVIAWEGGGVGEVVASVTFSRVPPDRFPGGVTLAPGRTVQAGECDLTLVGLAQGEPPRATLRVSCGQAATPVVAGGADPGGAPDPGLACTRDDDCVVSCVRRDDCCSQLCNCTNLYARTSLQRVEDEHRQRCHDPCPVASCMPVTEHTVAHCVQGLCRGTRVPL